MVLGVVRLLTLIQFHIRDGLPFVHGDEPARVLVVGAATSSAREIDDEF